MFTGALASSYYGRPRTTLDIDVVIAAQRQELAMLANWLSKADLDVQARRIQAAWESNYRIVTIEDEKSPHTLDVIFADGKLERKAGRILGVPTYYETAESLILAKLRMLKVTVRAERATTDREDIKAILETTRVDMKFLRKRARAENTAKMLDELTP